MSRRGIGWCCSFLLAALASLFLADAGRTDDGPPTTKLGKKIENISIRNGEKLWSLHDLKDCKAVVVVFLSFECPVSNSYAETLAELAKTYEERGVAFVGCCSNDEDAGWIAKQAKDFKIPFMVLKDEKRVAADALKAQITPEVFVLDHNFVLRYRGRIDDAYAARLKKNRQVSRHDLRQALDELLAGKPVSEPATLAIGCPISTGTPDKVVSNKVTYHRDVLPILQNHCQTCHRPGAVAPFSLLTYKQAANWAPDIKYYTQTGKMPPWKPTAGPTFHDERRLSEQEKATLAAWVDNGAPEGDPKDAPSARQFPDDWQLGPPDLVLTMTDEYHLGPSGSDVFRCMVLPTNLPEDMYITALEVRPGNPRIVHHAVLFYDTSGRARAREEAERKREKDPNEKDHGPGYTAMMGIGFTPRANEPPPILGAWAPGQAIRHFPEGVGYFLPKGADIVVQMHYSRSGRPEKDRTTIGLYLSKKPETKRLHFIAAPAMFLAIPAGAERYKVQGKVTIDTDCVLHSIFPHMHLIGKEIKITMTPPDGSPQTLIAIDDWDFNWQGDYFFKEPIPVKAGTSFEIEGVYDNSAKNPANPYNPPRPIFIGMDTRNEMCIAALGATTEKGNRIRMTIAGERPFRLR